MDLDRIRRNIKAEEGLRLKPYKCSEGCWTIAYGHRILKEEYFPDGITQEMADFLFEADLTKAIRGAESFVGPLNFETLCDARQHCLIDLVWNLGLEGLNGFKKFKKAVLSSDWVEASKQLENSVYFVQVRNRAKRNMHRILTGEEPE